MSTPTYDRIVIGAGLFGTYASLVLARRGWRVLLLESDDELMGRASVINQARLHTGLHYPRSLLTGREALRSYRRFREEFAPAIRDFEQIYAIASHGSKTSPQAFESYAARLPLAIERVDPHRWFRPDRVSAAYRVEEPSFDAGRMRELLTDAIRFAGVELRLRTTARSLHAGPGGVRVTLDDRQALDAEGVVLATYANLNGLRSTLGLAPLPLAFEMTEVVLTKPPSGFENLGITLMDGMFWLFMPFGFSPLSSVTNVGITPLARSESTPVFECQHLQANCTPAGLAHCNRCPSRPASLWRHQLQQMAVHLKRAFEFEYRRSLLTVKTVLRAAEVDDTRPTLIRHEPGIPVWSVFAGKVSTIFDMEEQL